MRSVLNQITETTQLDISDSDSLRRSCIQTYKDLLNQLFYYTDTAGKNPVISTHQIRKKLKLFRAFLKLLKGFKTPSETREVNLTIRNYGKIFSDLRDAHVRQLLLSELKSENSDNNPVLEILEELNAEDIKKAEQLMIVEQNEFSLLKKSWMLNQHIEKYFMLNNPDSSAVLEVFSLSYFKSFTAFNASLGSLDPDLLHEWRKRLKDVQYQLELIYWNLSSDIREHYLNIEELCNILGVLNDWDMMNHWVSISQNKWIPDRNHVSNFYEDLINKQKDLLNNAISVGHELYRFTPEMFKEKLN
jgi:CHAD domain-containing protein